MNKSNPISNKIIALPQDHGSWVFLFTPLIIGWFFSSNPNFEMAALTISAITFFLMRQPISILVKVLSGRRPEKDKKASIFWTFLYGAIGLVGLLFLLWRGKQLTIFLLLIPGVILLTYYLIQISNHTERRQKTFEMVSTGMLSELAPILLFLDRGTFIIQDLFLWLLLWFQAAASIEYAFSRLNQRNWNEVPESKVRIQNGMDALIKTGLNLIFVYMLSSRGLVGKYLWIAYLLQLGETILSIRWPGINTKPVMIGFRQLGLSIAFLILFLLLW